MLIRLAKSLLINSELIKEKMLKNWVIEVRGEKWEPLIRSHSIKYTLDVLILFSKRI